MIELAKRLADWLLMASAGSLLVGLFQSEDLALVVCIASLAGSLVMTWVIVGHKNKKREGK